MTEPRRPNWDDTFIWTGAVWDTAFRAMLAEISYAFAWMMTHETDSGGGVVGGFKWESPSALTTRIGRGLALIWDSGIAAPGPKWKWVFRSASSDLAHSARHATLDRVDAVSVSYALTEDTSQSLGRGGGAGPANTNTQAGCTTTLVITAGTAHADPWANKGAAPAGDLLLYYVLVPSTADGGAIEAFDARAWMAGASNRPYDQGIVLRGDAGATYYELFDFQSMSVDGGAAYLSRLLMNAGVDWPLFERSGMGIAGEKTGEFYPMMIPSGGSGLERTWRRTVPWMSREARYDSGAAADTPIAWHAGDVTKITRATDAAVDVYWFQPIPVEGRALKVMGATIAYDYDVAFDSPLAVTAELVHRAANGTQTVLSKINIANLGVTTGTETKTFTFGADGSSGSFVATVLASGDSLFCRVRVQLADTNNTDGALYMSNVTVLLKEGQI